MIYLNDILTGLLADENIPLPGFLPFGSCKIINRPLLDRSVGFTPLSAAVFAVPYFSGSHPGRNVSLYAVPKDYHLYFAGLFDRLCGKLSEKFPDAHFRGFSDHSPISEVDAAARCGIGIIGDLSQLITPVYGSHVFIGEILTDAPCIYTEREPEYCPHCGKCTASCPTCGTGCFSEMNQRKGELDPLAEKLIIGTGIVWGCDVCREACPLNKKIPVTPIGFFRRDLEETLSSEKLASMSDEEFRERAYSFRGKNTVLRNVLLLEKAHKNI